jgi:hypothetical protein
LVVVQTVHLLQFFSGLWFFPALVSLCCVSVCTHTLFHAIGPLQVGRELYEKKKKGKNRGGQFHRFFFFFSLFDFFLSLTPFFWISPPPFCCLGNWSRPLLLCFLLCPGGMRIGQAFALIVSGV